MDSPVRDVTNKTGNAVGEGEQRSAIERQRQLIPAEDFPDFDLEPSPATVSSTLRPRKQSPGYSKVSALGLTPARSAENRA
jgi:hypothetical protein